MCNKYATITLPQENIKSCALVRHCQQIRLFHVSDFDGKTCKKSEPYQSKFPLAHRLDVNNLTYISINPHFLNFCIPFPPLFSESTVHFVLAWSAYNNSQSLSAPQFRKRDHTRASMSTLEREYAFRQSCYQIITIINCQNIIKHDCTSAGAGVQHVEDGGGAGRNSREPYGIRR